MQSISKWIALIVFLISSLFFITYADPPAPTPVGRVIWVKGILRAVMPNGEERSLKKMSIIYLRDTLWTDEKSQAEVAFTDNSLVTFGPNTQYYINDYQFDSKNKKTVGKFIVNFIQGSFRAITGIIAKTDSGSYEVETPVGTLGVRGTDYAAYYKNGVLLVAVYKGTVCMRPKQTGPIKPNPVCTNEKQRYLRATKSGIELLSQPPADLGPELSIEYTTIDDFNHPSGKSSNGFCISY